MSNLLFFRRSCAYRHAARTELHKARSLPRGMERDQALQRVHRPVRTGMRLSERSIRPTASAPKTEVRVQATPTLTNRVTVGGAVMWAPF